MLHLQQWIGTMTTAVYANSAPTHGTGMANRDVSRYQSDTAPAALDWSMNQRQPYQSDAAPAAVDWHHDDGRLCQFSTDPRHGNGKSRRKSVPIRHRTCSTGLVHEPASAVPIGCCTCVMGLAP